MFLQFSSIGLWLREYFRFWNYASKAVREEKADGHQRCLLPHLPQASLLAG